jgi:hypothetical protein
MRLNEVELARIKAAPHNRAAAKIEQFVILFSTRGPRRRTRANRHSLFGESDPTRVQRVRFRPVARGQEAAGQRALAPAIEGLPYRFSYARDTQQGRMLATVMNGQLNGSVAHVAQGAQHFIMREALMILSSGTFQEIADGLHRVQRQVGKHNDCGRLVTWPATVMPEP